MATTRISYTEPVSRTTTAGIIIQLDYTSRRATRDLVMSWMAANGIHGERIPMFEPIRIHNKAIYYGRCKLNLQGAPYVDDTGRIALEPMATPLVVPLPPALTPQDEPCP